MLNHYTITTGHNRVSPRSEVSAAAIAAVSPMLRADGTHEMPGFPEYRVIVTSCDATLTATVVGSRDPIVTMYVCHDAEGLRGLVGCTGCIPAVALTAPALLVDVHGADLALEWLGDFERCLAWAWLEQRQ